MGTSSEALRPYVPALVAAWPADAAPPARREVSGTLVMADLTGFTALSERLARLGREGAEELTGVIDRLFAEIITAGHSYGGQLLSFGGDSLLLLFDGEGHALRAAVTADAIRSHVRVAGEQRTGVGKVKVRVSIGVNSGTFHAMLVGTQHRVLVMGGREVSNTVEAEGSAQAGEIVLTAAAAAGLAARDIRERDGRLLLRQSPPAEFPAAPVMQATTSEVGSALPPAVRARLSSSVDLLEHRSATVAFLRVEDLDRRLSADPETATRAVADVVDVVQRACATYDVCLLTSDVDRDAFKLILTAGVPLSAGDDEERVLLAGREILDADLPLPIRIGANRGSLFAGVVGAPERRTYTVMGDTVNLAARVMSATPIGRLRVTTDVVDRSRQAFRTAAVEPFAVKGKKGLTHAVEVEAPEATKLLASDVGVNAFGRDQELSVLRATWSDAVDSQSTRFVEVAGDPGIGKTTLVDSFISEIEPDRHIRLRGDLATRTTPYRGLASLLQAGCELPVGRSSEPNLIRLGEQLSPELRERLPLINDVLGTELAPISGSTALVDDNRRRALAALATELLATCLTSTTLFEFEDTHLFDEATAEWLAGVAANSPARPWCVVSTRRQVESGFALDPSHGQAIALGPLDAKAAESLIRAERGDRSTPPELVRQLSQRADGNPLYLRELVRALDQGETLENLPDSLDALLTARLDQLPAADRHLVCRASVLGLRFSPDLLPTVVDESVVAATPSVLSRIADFVGPAPGERLGFTHALIRDSAYQLLPFGLRRTLHGNVAQHLAEQGNAEAGLLSFHYFAAQDWPRAWQTSRAAAESALAAHAPVEAAQLLERAYQSGRRQPGTPIADLLLTGLQLGRSYERSSQYEAAEQAYRRLTRLDVAAPDRARLKVQFAWLAERQSKLSLAVRRARAAVTLLDQLGTPDSQSEVIRAEARTIEGMALEVMGRHEAAAGALSEAVQLAREHGADRTEAEAAAILDWALAMCGRLDEPRHLTRALELYRSLGDVLGEAGCLTNLGALAYMNGQWDTAVDYYQAGQQAQARSGNDTNAAVGAANIAEVLSDQGHWGEASELLDEALGVWQSTGHEHGVAYALGLKGRTLCRLGHDIDGLTALADSRERHLALRVKGDAAQVWLWIAEAHALAGRADVCEQTLRAGADDGSVTARRIRATAVALGDGLASLAVARETATTEGEDFEIVVIDHTLAVLDPANAERHRAASRPLATQLGVVRVAVPPVAT